MTYNYRDKLRRTLMDMHIENWNPEFMSQFDPEAYFESLKIAKINAPMIYIQSHVGLCYWPTKSGEMHSGLIGKEDAMKRLFDLCHDDGMAVVAYYSIIYNNWAYHEHPEWQMRDLEGRGSRATGKRYGLCCPNNMEYRDFIRTQMAEFCDYFDFEGIFLDMTFWPMVCYCDECRARWEKEVGGPMPKVIDWKDDRWNLFQRKRQEWMEDFALDMTAEIKKHKPECAVEHQYSNAVHMWNRGVNENIAKASDYAGGDLYGGIAQQSFACKLYYNLTQIQPFEYMTSRCYPALSEHTTTKSMDQLRASILVTALHHGASLMIDAIDPKGTHDRRVYEAIGQVHGEMEHYEKYLTRGKMAYDVGVYFNLNGKMDVENNGVKIGSKEETDDTMPHLDAFIGAGKSLQRHHIPYTVLNNWKLELLKDTKVVVLADAPMISEKERDALRKYVKDGGRLYMSGHSAPELAEEFFGGTIEGLTQEDITYISPTEGTDWMQGYFTKDYPLVMFERSFKMKGQKNGEVLGTLTLPYTVPNPLGIFTDLCSYASEIVTKDDPRYPFATIHANPPGIFTDYPAVLKTQYGKGTVIWSCVPFEKAERFQHSDIFSGLIRSLLSEEPVFSSSTAPEPVEFVVFDAPEYKEKYIGMVNLQEDFRFLPVYHFDVEIKSPEKPVKVLKSYNDEPVAFTYENGKVKISIDRLDCFDMYTLCYA